MMSTGSINAISGVSQALLVAGLGVGIAANTGSGSTSAAGTTTSVVTYADGSSVTTVRNKAGQIISITITPPISTASAANMAAPGSAIDLFA